MTDDQYEAIQLELRDLNHAISHVHHEQMEAIKRAHASAFEASTEAHYATGAASMACLFAGILLLLKACS